MDFNLSTLTESLMAKLGESFPNIVGAIAILLVGWVLALVLRVAVRRGLRRLQLNRRLAGLTDSQLDAEKGFALGAFFVVLALALIAFLNTLDLAQVSGPLGAMVERVLTYLPNVLAAVLLGLVAWAVATLLRTVVGKGLAAARFQERLKLEGAPRVDEMIGNVAYGLTLLLFLPGILSTLGLDGLLEPVGGVVDRILGMVPNLFAAVVIGGIGWLVARILRDVVTNLTAATGIDEGAAKLGFAGTSTVSRLVGLLVFIFVFVPALIAALEALKLETVSRPATEVLATLMGAIPYVFAAAVILFIAVFLADLAANLASSLLGGIGFDRLPEKLGLARTMPEGRTPSVLAGMIIKFAILLLSVVEAAEVLGFAQVSAHLDTLVGVGGQVLLGLTIMAIGWWAAGLAHSAVARLEGARAWAGLLRFAVLGLTFAMGLRAMGIAEDIVTLAFSLTIGAVAVAVALSFGLGGREAAGRQMDAWLAQLRGERRGGEELSR